MISPKETKKFSCIYEFGLWTLSIQNSTLSLPCVSNFICYNVIPELFDMFWNEDGTNNGRGSA